MDLRQPHVDSVFEDFNFLLYFEDYVFQEFFYSFDLRPKVEKKRKEKKEKREKKRKREWQVEFFAKTRKFGRDSVARGGSGLKSLRFRAPFPPSSTAPLVTIFFLSLTRILMFVPLALQSSVDCQDLLVTHSRQQRGSCAARTKQDSVIVKSLSRCLVAQTNAHWEVVRPDSFCMLFVP